MRNSSKSQPPDSKKASASRMNSGANTAGGAPAASSRKCTANGRKRKPTPATRANRSRKKKGRSFEDEDEPEGGEEDAVRALGASEGMS